MRRQATWSHLLFPGLIILALSLFFVPETEVNAMRGRTLSIVSPVLRIFKATSHGEEIIPACINVPMKSADPKTITEAPKNREAELTAQNAMILARLEEEYARNLRLQSELNRLSSAGAMPQQASIMAEVMGRRAALWQEPILALSRGEADGVRLNAGVLHRGAVLGRIISIGAHASCMALLTHRGLSVAARLVDCRVEGVMTGTKEEGEERICKMSVVGREVDVKLGEHVVTSGLDGTFPSGLWLGTVTAIRKAGDVQWELTVRPACSENVVESVHILTGAPPEVPWPAIPVKQKKPVEKK